MSSEATPRVRLTQTAKRAGCAAKHPPGYLLPLLANLPKVDDPFEFGQVAAANALSDVYAMGGRPISALGIVGFPDHDLPVEVLAEILRGGALKAKEAGIDVVGGHTIKTDEPIYGLAVVGEVHPQRIVSNAGAQPGDALVLTKPLGIGVIATANVAGTDRDSHEPMRNEAAIAAPTESEARNTR